MLQSSPDGKVGNLKVLRSVGPENPAIPIPAFLASDAGAFHSGSVITLDGGRDNWFGPWPPAGIVDEAGEPPAEARRS